ncbi:glycosyltransferase [Candidatus Pelagibacter sp.]|nr:glycosyltransferase [Candidatus Pelagibacter sp.]
MKIKTNFIILVPTLNEEKNIKRLYFEYKKLPKKLSYHLLFVDDSTNNLTKLEILKYFKKKCTIISSNKSKSKTSSRFFAFSKGLKYAVKNFNFKYLLDTDVDLPSMIYNFRLLNDSFLNKKSNVVIFSKYHKNAIIKNRTISRRILSYIINFLLKLIYGYDIQDYTSCRAYDYKICKIIASKKITFITPIGNIEILTFLKKLKVKINHIPFIYIDIRKGKSSVNFNTFIACFRDFLKLIKKKII